MGRLGARQAAASTLCPDWKQAWSLHGMGALSQPPGPLVTKGNQGSCPPHSSGSHPSPPWFTSLQGEPRDSLPPLRAPLPPLRLTSSQYGANNEEGGSPSTRLCLHLNRCCGSESIDRRPDTPFVQTIPFQICGLGIYMNVKVKSLGRVRLFATPWIVAYQVPPSMGFSRQEYWSALPFPSPGDLSDSGIEPGSMYIYIFFSLFFLVCFSTLCFKLFLNIHKSR